MTGRSRKSAEDRKAEIVQTAIRLAGDLGPDRVTTQMLADAVGITQPAVFRHFPTKADIWLAVGGFIARAMAAEEIDDGQTNPAAHLADLVTRHLAYIERTPALPAILFSRELHAGNETLRRHFEQVMRNRHEGFARLIRRGIKTGVFRPDLDADSATDLVLAVIQGMAMRWSLENRRFDLVQEGDRVLASLLGSFQARP